MRRAVVLSFCVILLPGIAAAQQDVGSIDVFSDFGFTDCEFTDNQLHNVIYVYVVATYSVDGTTGSQWALDVPGAWLSLGFTSPFQTIIGEPRVGIAIAYSLCLTGDFHILTAIFLGYGDTPPCTHISIVPDPWSASGEIEIVDCQLPFPGKLFFGRLGQGIVNSDGTCDCTIPVQETTWGQVKALYRQ